MILLHFFLLFPHFNLLILRCGILVSYSSDRPGLIETSYQTGLHLSRKWSCEDWQRWFLDLKRQTNSVVIVLVWFKQLLTWRLLQRQNKISKISKTLFRQLTGLFGRTENHAAIKVLTIPINSEKLEIKFKNTTLRSFTTHRFTQLVKMSKLFMQGARG